MFAKAHRDKIPENLLQNNLPAKRLPNVLISHIYNNTLAKEWDEDFGDDRAGDIQIFWVRHNQLIGLLNYKTIVCPKEQ